jgi:hypothetical protein
MGSNPIGGLGFFLLLFGESFGDGSQECLSVTIKVISNINACPLLGSNIAERFINSL